MSRGSAGGKVRAIILRKKAIESYYANPNKCLHCGAVIPVLEHTKVQATRRKKFCNRSCAAKYNNLKYPKLHPDRKPTGTCQRCETVINFRKSTSSGFIHRRFCERCRALQRTNGRDTLLPETTKGALMKQSSMWMAGRTAICRHARLVYLRSGKPMVCAICGYDKFAMVAHIKAVSDFPDDTLVAIINSLDNLMALCPNHHREYDEGLLVLKTTLPMNLE